MEVVDFPLYQVCLYLYLKLSISQAVLWLIMQTVQFLRGADKACSSGVFVLIVVVGTIVHSKRL